MCGHVWEKEQKLHAPILCSSVQLETLVIDRCRAETPFLYLPEPFLPGSCRMSILTSSVGDRVCWRGQPPRTMPEQRTGVSKRLHVIIAIPLIVQGRQLPDRERGNVSSVYLNWLAAPASSCGPCAVFLWPGRRKRDCGRQHTSQPLPLPQRPRVKRRGQCRHQHAI